MVQPRELGAGVFLAHIRCTCARQAQLRCCWSRSGQAASGSNSIMQILYQLIKDEVITAVARQAEYAGHATHHIVHLTAVQRRHSEA
jgi:hypothetical protein